GRHDSSPYNSFPSGHTAGAVAVARAIGRDYPGIRVPALALAAGIAAVQVPRGKHYVSDVLAGAFIGLAADVAVERFARGLSTA
ncbi:MAG: phosphatase PAP2 family protein, partial [Sphingomicrobium sp.]